MPASGEKRGELQLLQAVIDKDPGAWNEFYARYQRLIIACIRKVLNRYSVSTALQDLDDLTNAVCLDLVRDDYKKLRSYDPNRGYKLSSWVGLITTNTAHDCLRRRGPTHASLDDQSSYHETRDESASPMELASLKEQQAALNRAVEHLSPGERTFLRYYYQEGLEPSEIAELMGISINTVYSRKNKVRANLRKIIERMDT